MGRTILAMTAMLAALILGSAVALAEARPAETTDSRAGANPCEPKVIDLGTLGGRNSAAYEVNDGNWVVGNSETRGGAIHSVLWKSGNVRDLGTLNFSDGEAQGINESGTIVGTLFNGDPFDENGFPAHARGFAWKKGEMKRLPTLSGNFSLTKSVNEKGVMAGSSTLPNGNERATIWRNGKVKNLGTLGGNYSYALGINDRGQIVGGSAKRRNGPPHAFLWKNGRMRDLGTLGGPASQANAINNSGRITGVADLPVYPKSHAAVWENGQVRDIGSLGGNFAPGLGINETGQVVGVSEVTREEPFHDRGFVWTGGLLLGLPTLGGDFGNAHDINYDGDIVGRSALPSGKEHATLYRCALGLNPNAYKVQGTSVSSAGSEAFSVKPSASSQRSTDFDRLEPWFGSARR
ncbi:hypothetical protein BH18ACT10_BH18ACT10_03970 [soil metagenome]